jgi:hypothetical protein
MCFPLRFSRISICHCSSVLLFHLSFSQSCELNKFFKTVIQIKEEEEEERKNFVKEKQQEEEKKREEIETVAIPFT